MKADLRIKKSLPAVLAVFLAVFMLFGAAAVASAQQQSQVDAAQQTAARDFADGIGMDVVLQNYVANTSGTDPVNSVAGLTQLLITVAANQPGATAETIANAAGVIINAVYTNIGALVGGDAALRSLSQAVLGARAAGAANNVSDTALQNSINTAMGSGSGGANQNLSGIISGAFTQTLGSSYTNIPVASVVGGNQGGANQGAAGGTQQSSPNVPIAVTSTPGFANPGVNSGTQNNFDPTASRRTSVFR